METKKFDGLVVKANTQNNVLDCCFCCINDNSCLECPLKDGFYFVEPSHSSIKPIRLRYLEVIDDLSWLVSHLDSSLSILAKSKLNNSLNFMRSINSIVK